MRNFIKFAYNRNNNNVKIIFKKIKKINKKYA